ncbi:MAG: hypothetical protein II399_00910 [Lachnospiraceae bacterium]|nr:hypothetical protein [Lachnospiraceae bacterium]
MARNRLKMAAPTNIYDFRRLLLDELADYGDIYGWPFPIKRIRAYNGVIYTFTVKFKMENKTVKIRVDGEKPRIHNAKPEYATVTITGPIMRKSEGRVLYKTSGYFMEISPRHLIEDINLSLITKPGERYAGK